MKRFFILFAMLVTFLSLFAEGNPATPLPHTCYDYKNPPSDLIPSWFEHLEFADRECLDYNEEFLQEHGGRVGTLVYYELPNGLTYNTQCSGTLIGENYFLTAGHCAMMEASRKNVGVLFGYQMADIYDDNDKINHPKYPRVSLYEGYLDNNVFRQYGEPGKPADFTEHPAYFQIIDDEDSGNGGPVEHGWGNVYWVDENGNQEIRKASEIEWPDGQKLGEMDYAIYKLKQNHDFYPAEALDPWPWRSENNHSSQNPLLPHLNLPWQLPDNTNGARGWARVNTAVLQTNSEINIIGHPAPAKITDEIKGLKIVNVGRVWKGKGRSHAIFYDEDLLIMEGADVWFGNSGSSVIDDSGRLAGVVSWTSCFKAIDLQEINIQNITILPTPILPARTYATPMWKICRASKIIKDAAKDQNCNGIVDWDDFIMAIISRLSNTFFSTDGFFLLNNLEPSSSSAELINYRYDATQQKVVKETKEIPAYTYQVALPDNGDLFYLTMQNGGFYLFKNGTVLGELSNYPLLNGSSTLVKGDDIYLAGGTLSVPHALLPGNEEYDLIPYQYITKISSNGQNGYSFSIVADLPSDFEDIRIFSLGNDIYVSGNTNGSFVIYKLVPNNQGENPYTLFPVSDTSQPERKDYNLTVSDGKIIVSGGATDYIRNVLNLEESQYDPNFAVYNNIIMLEPAVSTNWVTVAENINDKLILMSVTAIDNGNLVIVNPFITVGNSMQKIVMDLSEIPINGESLRVVFEFDPVVYCLSEAENTLAGGIGASGECVPFTHPFYNSFSAGTTVYSVAGKGARLYAGTNDSIKIYDISDPDSPVLVSSFSTNNARVNDLEIEGNVLFAATSKGLYKLDASDPDELEQILFVSTGSTSQNEIELYDGKVYVGDDSGIKIRDKETLSVLLSANSGSVYDFAIENGEIAMFRSSFWNSGIQFRNAETLVETAYDYTSCSNVEVENFNGRLYLACDNYTYSFEANNGYIYFTQLSGDKRDLRENYTYNGYTYTPDGNYIRLSTNEEVPAICGNGIVEGDEVCDGTPIDCDELDPTYVSGIAACNSTCDGYLLDNCTAGNGGDGW